MKSAVIGVGIFLLFGLCVRAGFPVGAADRSADSPFGGGEKAPLEQLLSSALHRRSTVRIELTTTNPHLVSEVFMGNNQIYVQSAFNGWNLIADSDCIYEWKAGSASGFRTKRDDDTLLAYLVALLDPGHVMSSTYSMYQKAPSQYVVTHEGPQLRIGLCMPGYSFAILVTESPFWMNGFEITNEGGIVRKYQVAEPEAVERMPEEMTQSLRQVSFEDSDQSLLRHLSSL